MTRNGIKAVVFSDPPPERTTKYDWTQIASQLQRKPGEWAKVYDTDRQTYAVAIRSNKIAALKRENGFESRTENNDNINQTCGLWLRFNPDKAGK